MGKERGRELRGTGRLRRVAESTVQFWSFCLDFSWGKGMHYGAGVVLMEIKTVPIGWCSVAGFILSLLASGALPSYGRLPHLVGKLLNDSCFITWLNP